MFAGRDQMITAKNLPLFSTVAGSFGSFHVILFFSS